MRKRERATGAVTVCAGVRDGLHSVSFIISHHPELPASYDARTGPGDTALFLSRGLAHGP